MLFGTLRAHAQDRHLIDSLKHELPNARREDRLEILTHLANAYRPTSPDSALKYSSQALEVARELSVAQGSAATPPEHQDELIRLERERIEAVILHQNQQRYGLMVLLTLAGALLFFQWRSARNLKRVNVALHAQKDQIAAQSEEIKSQLEYIAERHEEAISRKEEIRNINIELSETVARISHLNHALQNHILTLLEISKSKRVNFGTLDDAAKEIARLAGRALSVSRVSVWNYVESSKAIESIACYDLATDSYQDSMTLRFEDYPQYAEALLSNKVINAPEARTSPMTREFTEGYLVPLNIYSMLDVTYQVDGKLGGLICFEHQGLVRTWSSADVIFASSISDVITLTFHSVQRREYERRLKQQSQEIARMNEVLEERVKERTRELEVQNEQLSEYAFINSHLLRSPVSKILGLMNLMEIDGADHKETMKFLKSACQELDTVVRKITVALDGGEHFKRDSIEK